MGKPVLIEEETQLEQFKHDYDASQWMAQEYILGNSYYLLFYIKKSGEVFRFSQKNLIQQSGGRSIIAAEGSNIHTEKFVRKYENTFKKIGFYGLVMIEVMKKRDMYYAIEANPRFWGPSQLFVDCGVGFFELFLHDNGFNVELPVMPEGKKTRCYYFWGNGLKSTEKPDTFFNYSYEEMMRNWEFWQSVDIYNRPDTIELFDKGV